MTADASGGVRLVILLCPMAAQAGGLVRAPRGAVSGMALTALAVLLEGVQAREIRLLVAATATRWDCHTAGAMGPVASLAALLQQTVGGLGFGLVALDARS